VRYQGRAVPGVIETWDYPHLRVYVRHLVPVNGRPGGWYDQDDLLADGRAVDDFLADGSYPRVQPDHCDSSATGEPTSPTGPAGGAAARGGDPVPEHPPRRPEPQAGPLRASRSGVVPGGPDEPPLTGRELREGPYVEVADVVGDEEWRGVTSYDVTIVPRWLVD